MDIQIRSAIADDVPDLAKLTLFSGDGYFDAIYHDLIPGTPTDEIVERRFHFDGATASYSNCWVATARSQLLGMVHAYPTDDTASDPPDPLIPEDRKYLFEMWNLEAPGSFYINAIAVYPEHRGVGVGNVLMSRVSSSARERGFETLSLHVFAQNTRAVELYRRIGFEVVGRTPVVEHEMLVHSGDLLLMTRQL